MIIVSCDPGLYGAFCLYDTKRGSLVVHDIPTTKIRVGRSDNRPVIDEEAVVDRLTGFQLLGATHFVIEKVHGGPKMSGQAGFNFGFGFGVVLTAARCLGYSIEQVPPATWKGKLRVPADKRAARARAAEMLPTHKHLWPRAKHDGRAEAAMLALWAQQTFERDAK